MPLRPLARALATLLAALAAGAVLAADAPLWTAPVKGVRAAPVLIEKLL